MSGSATLAKVIEQFREREALGLAKYGTTVDREDLDAIQWAQHHKEELMDGVLYLQRLIDKLREARKA